ncbi:hypothetical protein MTR_6g061150 [Medicago truncatula]|uniref:Uncharacterized protein n=1 Tax=Medicago truncatula TaxID=3880 RepID=A0A072UKW0_MEDTR|nr:hypothetical protein MTR_6g061150 [Medicago truncatula]
MHTITCKLMKSVINFTISMEEGFVALINCDGAVVIDKGVADCGGVICDSEGNFNVVFSVYISLIRVESDSSVAIKPIKDGCTKEHQSFQLVEDIHRNYNGKGTIMWNYICRQGHFYKFGGLVL